jgi:hypothetical protein
MIEIYRKVVIDHQGRPKEVLIRWEAFQHIAQVMGLDLDTAALEDLRQAREDREGGVPDVYVDLDSL